MKHWEAGPKRHQFDPINDHRKRLDICSCLCQFYSSNYPSSPKVKFLSKKILQSYHVAQQYNIERDMFLIPTSYGYHFNLRAAKPFII